MAEAKPKVTLIGKVLAIQGLEFIYEGPLQECGTCSVKKACNNLKAGRRYRIVGVRPTQHRCAVHHDCACTVEVTESPVPAFISADMAIKNTRIHYEFSCNRTACSSYDLCHPEGITEGEKYIVANVIGVAPDHCERGRNLQQVELLPL